MIPWRKGFFLKIWKESVSVKTNFLNSTTMHFLNAILAFSMKYSLTIFFHSSCSLIIKLFWLEALGHSDQEEENRMGYDWTVSQKLHQEIKTLLR